MPDYEFASKEAVWALGEAFFEDADGANPNGYVGFGVTLGCGGNIDWWEIYWK